MSVKVELMQRQLDEKKQKLAHQHSGFVGTNIREKIQMEIDCTTAELDLRLDDIIEIKRDIHENEDIAADLVMVFEDKGDAENNLKHIVRLMSSVE